LHGTAAGRDSVQIGRAGVVCVCPGRGVFGFNQLFAASVASVPRVDAGDHLGSRLHDA